MTGVRDEPVSLLKGGDRVKRSFVHNGRVTAATRLIVPIFKFAIDSKSCLSIIPDGELSEWQRL